MSGTAPELRRVKRAAQSARRSREEYRHALLEARAAGLTCAAIAQAAGVTRQAVEKLTRQRS